MQDRVVLVTGGSRGLGRAIALAAARRGARVAFTWTRDEDAAQSTLGELRAIGEAHAYRVSVTDAAGTAAMLKALEAGPGPVDALVNNAAISQNLPLPLLEEDDFDKVMDVNVKGTYLTSRAVARTMIRRKQGVILNIGSLAGERILDAPVHYCASKAAVSGLTRGLAKELSRHGIRVLCLAPGLLEDGLGRNVPEHRLADYLGHCALGRVGRLDEIGELAVWLLSDASALANGATLLADGGL
ncbi:MAG: SDR family oxidoreductase [Myxococcales bacterium]|nr:SDR family oxidoreductase [Myxococcales bacterium]